MELLDFTIRIAEKAGKLILKRAKKDFTIMHKSSRNDLVTDVDKEAEELIKKEIKARFPDHMIIAEESENKKPKKMPEYIWIIDPIDGTTNFARGLDWYAISIGLFKTDSIDRSKNFEYLSGEIVLGVVYAPKLDQMFYAEKGEGSYLNGKRIKVSQTKKVADALMCTGFPANQKEPNIHYFSEMLDRCQAIRRFGAASLDLCYIAKGVYDGYWEFGLSAWDIAAGALIVEEAGGKVTDSNGNTLDLFGGDIFASNGKIHEETVDIFGKV